MDTIEIEQGLIDLGMNYNDAMQTAKEWDGCTTDEFDRLVEAEIENIEVLPQKADIHKYLIIQRLP